MNLTVGPLPPAVYWRRRAVVVGVLLVLVLLVTYACGGSGSNGSAGSPRADVGTGTTVANPPDPTGSVLHPQTGSPPDSGSPAPSLAPAPAAAPAVQTSGPAQSDFCADSEIRLTPSAQKIVGGSFPYMLTLRIKNVSDRTCKRDVGADPQELHIVLNGQTVWSSDACQTVHGQPDIRTFPPGIEDSFTIGWDGTIGTACNNKTPATPGGYQVVGRLDSKTSDPVAFAVG